MIKMFGLRLFGDVLWIMINFFTIESDMIIEIIIDLNSSHPTVIIIFIKTTKTFILI